MQLQRQNEKKLLPAEQSWLILNNLQQFNDKPQFIEELLNKLYILKDHVILGMFVDYYEEAYKNYYEKHGSFPDMVWFQNSFKKSKPLKILDDDFSMSLYETAFFTIFSTSSARSAFSILRHSSNSVTVTPSISANGINNATSGIL